MIENPENIFDEFAKAGSDYITVHYEACKDNLFEVIEQIKRHNIKAGVSIKPKTPASAVIDILGKIDLLLIMSVETRFRRAKIYSRKHRKN
jgi:ribulose-phosphate 3-epimerase